MIGDAVRAAVLASTSVAALVGTRMYPDALAQADPSVSGSFPAISYQNVAERRAGTFGKSDTMPAPLFQIDSWDVTKLGAESLARLVRIQLDNYAGTVGGETITRAILEGQRDDFQPDVKLYRVIQEYRVWWSED